MKTLIDVVKEVEERTKSLGRFYGIRIQLDYVLFAARLTKLNMHDSKDWSGLGEKVLVVMNLASQIVLREIETGAEERELERYQYILFRSLVEYNELIKEKDHFSNTWLPRVEKELRNAENKLVEFINIWKPLLPTATLMLETFGKVFPRLNTICDFLVDLRSREENDMPPFKKEEIDLVLQELDAQIHKQYITLGRHHILQAVSQLTGIPASWLDTTFKERILRLKERLGERVLGQDILINILISNLLLRKALDNPGPLGSFLLLGCSGIGKAELAKAIAKELYDDEERLIRIDMTEYMEPHSISRLFGSSPRLGNCKEEPVWGQLTEAVRSRPYSVVLLEKIEKAHYSVIESLLPILKYGKLTDSHGSVIDFTNTLIIMTSYVGEEHYRLNCTCYFTDENEKEKWGRNPTIFHKKHQCDLKLPVPDRVRKEARRFFKPELLKSLDDVLAFDVLNELKAVCRLLLRDLACAMVDRGHRGLVIYPSNAALVVILMNARLQYGSTGKAIKRWLDENIDSMLLKVLKECEYTENSTIYIDTLVGTEELSFRLENNYYMVEDWLFKLSDESFNRLWVTYLEQRRWVLEIFKFKSFNSIWMDKGLTQIEIAAVDMFRVFVYKFLELLNSTQRPVFVSRSMVAKLCCSEKDGVQGLRSRLQNRVSEQQEALDVISDAVLRSIDAPLNPPNRPAGTYLFLGLTAFGKMELIKGITEHLLNDEWKDLLLHINLSEYSDLHSRVLGSSEFNNEIQDFWILEAVRKRPYSILIFDQVEKANAEVFSTLLQILDTGVLADGQGLMVDFRNATIILNSDLGNKKIISKIFGHSSPVDIQYGNIQQGVCRFRSELLNRIDEIVFFNPLSQEQLREVKRLAMMEGDHLIERGGYSMQATFFYLFSENDQSKIAQKTKLTPEMLPENAVVSHISQGLTKNNGACAKKFTCRQLKPLLNSGMVLQ